MAFTYILECADGSYYVGSTWDLERRLHEHNIGLGAIYTRRSRRRPVKVVWSLEFERIDDAFAFEKQIQRWGRAKRQALIDGRIENLHELAGRSWRSLQIKESLKGNPLLDEPDD